MIVTIFTTISQKGDLGEDFDEDPLRHAFHDDLAQSQGEGRVALKVSPTARAFPRNISSRSSRLSASAGLLDVTRGTRAATRLSRDAKCHHAGRHRRRLRGRLGVARLHGVALCLRAAPRTARSRRVWGGLQVAIGDYHSRLTLAARRLFRRRCQLVIYHQTSFAYHV